jgi:nitrogen fixation NifU-like protein
MSENAHEKHEVSVSQNLLKHAQYPQNIGTLTQPSGYAATQGQCGDLVEVAIAVRDEKIEDIRLLPHGCLFTVACASALAELAQGMTIDEALDLEPDRVVEVLDGLPEDHLHCARLVVNGLGEAIADYFYNNGNKKSQ